LIWKLWLRLLSKSIRNSGQWESFIKSLKQNLNIEQSPTKTITTQLNHIFLTFLAFIELEKMRVGLNKNHFSIIRSLYINATKQAILMSF